MELREPIESINQRLLDTYGRPIDDERAKFRVVWSDDQLEKRWVTHTKDGFELLQPIVKEVPKYKQYIRHRYILERLQPIVGETDLTEKVCYEIVWNFSDKNGKYVPPWFEACRHIIDNILNNMAVKSYYAKYKDNMSKEQYLADLQKMEDELFGNETDVTDALTYGSAIVVPNNYKTH